MTVNDMKTGDYFMLTTTKIRPVDKNVIFFKVNNDNHFMSVKTLITNVRYDKPVPEGRTKIIRKHGHDFFPETEFYKWMTSEEPFVDVKREIFVNSRAGRSLMNMLLVGNDNMSITKHLEEFEMEMQVPNGYTRKYGNKYIIKSKIHLPTFNYLVSNKEVIKQCVIGGDISTCESKGGSGYYCYNFYTIKRDSFGSSTDDMDSYARIFPDRVAFINPIIKLKADTEIYSLNTHNNIYFIRDLTPENYVTFEEIIKGA